MSKTRAEGAEALEEWADRVESAELKVAFTEALRAIAELVEQRDEVDEELIAAVRSQRRAHRSWSEIGAMPGVSKRAARRKYASDTSPSTQVESPREREPTTSYARDPPPRTSDQIGI